MPRILSIDFGMKRTGLAVTDPLQIIANGLPTIATSELENWLKKYTSEEEVEHVVIGYPTHLDGNPTYLTPKVEKLAKRIEALFPHITTSFEDERFTSYEAKQIIIKSGAKKKKRQDKSLVDKVSAIIILQNYLESTRYSKR